MAGAETVVVALGALGETRQAAAHAQGADAVAAAGENLMWISLMADIPDEPIAWGVEHEMQGDRELDHAETGAQMTAGHRNRVDGLATQLGRNLLKLLGLEFAQVFGRIDLVEKGGL